MIVSFQRHYYHIVQNVDEIDVQNVSNLYQSKLKILELSCNKDQAITTSVQIAMQFDPIHQSNEQGHFNFSKE